jgi:hypothetical protein
VDDALLMHRLHFGFTVTFHYLFAPATHDGTGAADRRVEDNVSADRLSTSLVQNARSGEHSLSGEGKSGGVLEYAGCSVLRLRVSNVPG